MDKENVLNNNQFEGLTARDIWEKLYNKELNTKKHILEYIEITRVLKKENVNEDQIIDTYNYIYNQIEGLKTSVKPNTMMYLKNQLKSQLGKYVIEKDPKPIDHFVEFFKEAFPEGDRRKDFTRVLNNVNSISEDQLWTTLTYINRECLNNDLELDSNEIKDIVEVIKNAVKKNNVRFITKLRTLKLLNDMLNISIVKDGDKFKVKNQS